MASQADKFDRTDFRTRRAPAPLWWPIPLEHFQSVGQSVMKDRGTGQPHKGVDIFADSDSPVLSVGPGRVIRVIDGRKSPRGSSRWRAGLWVDVQGADKRIYRYLHLGSATVKDGQTVSAGTQIGTVAPPGTSGVEHSGPHVHFEVRASDYTSKAGDYGTPIDPLRLLPPLTLS